MEPMDTQEPWTRGGDRPSMEAELALFRGLVNTRESEYKELLEHYANSEKKAINHVHEIKCLHAKMWEYKTLNTILDSGKKVSEEKICKLENKVKNLQAHYCNLEETKNSREREICELKKDNQSLHIKINQLEQALQSRAEELETKGKTKTCTFLALVFKLLNTFTPTSTRNHSSLLIDMQSASSNPTFHVPTITAGPSSITANPPSSVKETPRQVAQSASTPNTSKPKAVNKSKKEVPKSSKKSSVPVYCAKKKSDLPMLNKSKDNTSFLFQLAKYPQTYATVVLLDTCNTEKIELGSSENKFALVLAICGTNRIDTVDRDLVEQLKERGFANVVLVVVKSGKSGATMKCTQDNSIDSGVAGEKVILQLVHMRGKLLDDNTNTEHITKLLALAKQAHL